MATRDPAGMQREGRNAGAPGSGLVVISRTRTDLAPPELFPFTAFFCHEPKVDTQASAPLSRSAMEVRKLSIARPE